MSRAYRAMALAGGAVALLAMAGASFYAGMQYGVTSAPYSNPTKPESLPSARDLFDLQSKCAAAAERFTDPWDQKKENKNYRRRHHYNVALQKCFLRMSYTSEKDGRLYEADQIKDVLEGAVWGRYLESYLPGQEAEAIMCDIFVDQPNEQTCETNEEWLLFAERMMRE